MSASNRRPSISAVDCAIVRHVTMTLSSIETVMLSRRSVPKLVEPAPSSSDLMQWVRLAGTAPDHGKLRPWEFIEIRPDAFASLGEIFANSARVRAELDGQALSEEKLERERRKLERAPLVVVAAAVTRDSGKIPWIEQYAAVVAATQNLLLAATAAGWGSMWRTGSVAYDREVKAALGLTDADGIVGFIYLGTDPASADRPARALPEPALRRLGDPS